VLVRDLQGALSNTPRARNREATLEHQSRISQQREQSLGTILRMGGPHAQVDDAGWRRASGCPREFTEVAIQRHQHPRFGGRAREDRAVARTARHHDDIEARRTQSRDGRPRDVLVRQEADQ
jgi:hypothetical protein